MQSVLKVEPELQEGRKKKQSIKNEKTNLILLYTWLKDNSVIRCITFVRFKCK